MNKNLNLYEILKNCPKGTKLYSPIFGEVTFHSVLSGNDDHPIEVRTKTGYIQTFTKHGLYYNDYADGERLLFPSKENRDWSKFKVNKPKFNPKTFQSFDRILVLSKNEWVCRIISHTKEDMIYVTSGGFYDYCIPYNEETKHLVGTNKEAPEYYRYWED